jgi:hypothetical protein
MPSTKSIKKNIKRQTNELYNTLVGSIVWCVGAISGKSEIQMKKTYNTLKKNKQVLPNTVIGITDYIWTVFGNDDKKALRAYMVLLTDKRDLKAPRVVLLNSAGNVVPLPSGIPTGIIADAIHGKDNVEVEWLYNEDGTEIEEENDNNE